MPSDWQTSLALIAIGFIGSFVYGITGFGSGLVTVPLAALLVELPFALAVFALIDGINVVRVWTSSPQAVVRSEATRLLPACLLGVAIGMLLLTWLPARALMGAYGGFLILYTAYGLLVRGKLPVVAQGWAYASGFAGGVCSALFGAGGPPFAVYLSLRSLDKHQLRATLALTSLVSISARLIAFALAGLLSSPKVWLTALAVAPATLLALALADRLHAVLPRERVLLVIRILVGAAGVGLILRASGLR